MALKQIKNLDDYKRGNLSSHFKPNAIDLFQLEFKNEIGQNKKTILDVTGLKPSKEILKMEVRTKILMMNHREAEQKRRLRQQNTQGGLKKDAQHQKLDN